MNFVSARIITADIIRLVAFYEKATATPAMWSTPDFAELTTPNGTTVAIGSTNTVALFAPGSAKAAANDSVILEFLVDDVDLLWEVLASWVHDAPESTAIVAEPTTMPWGNRSLLIRDPDGNLVNFFTPVTAPARAKFGL